MIQGADPAIAAGADQGPSPRPPVPDGSADPGLIMGPWPFLWLGVAVLLLYIPTLFYGLTGFDDQYLVAEALRANRDGLASLFTRPAIQYADGLFYYRPVMMLTLAIETAAGGGAPLVHHAGNILIHLAAVSLFFLTALAWRFSRSASLAMALVLAVHPVLASGAAWIAGRNDSLLAVFILSAFIPLVRMSGMHFVPVLACHFAFFTLALFTKETALLFPAFCLLYIALRENRLWFDRRSMLLYLSWASAIGCWFWFRHRAQLLSQGDGSFTLNSVADVFKALVVYAGKLVLPVNLSGLPVSQDMDIRPGLLALGIIGVAAVFLKAGDRQRFVLGLAWFGLMLVPPLVLGNGFRAFYEHRLYLPMAGLLVALGSLKPAARFSFSDRRHLLFFLTMIGALAAATARYQQTYRNELTFWSRAIETASGSAEARYNAGQVFQRWGMPDRAEQQYLAALSIAPEALPVQYNLAMRYLRTGRPEMARRLLLRAAARHPENGEVKRALMALPAEAVSTERGRQPSHTRKPSASGHWHQ